MPLAEQVTISRSYDVYTNLALEEALFESERRGPEIFLYRNRPSVVIGRNQNPWVECDIAAMERDGVLLARRVSGGGTVYHDPGNLNYSWIGPREVYDRSAVFDHLVDSLRSVGIAAQRTERNDLVAGERKFSGSAFRFTRTRALHHGTLLIESDLDRLVHYLRPRGHAIRSRGTASVRSSVVNLADAGEQRVTPQEIIAAIAAGAPIAWFNEATVDLLEARDNLERLRDPAWLWGKTPAFSEAVETNRCVVDVLVEHGSVTQVNAAGADATLEPVRARWVGHWYSPALAAEIRFAIEEQER